MDALVSLPKLTINIESEPLAIDDARAITDIRVQQRLSMPSLCEISFVDVKGDIANSELFSVGKLLDVMLQDCTDSIFSGQITAIEYIYNSNNERIVRIRGYDKLHQLRKRQPVYAHIDLTLLELVQALTADLGVSVNMDTPGPVWKKLIQYRQSDLELITEMSERCGLYYYLHADELIFTSLEGYGEPVSLCMADSLLEVRVTANTDPACRSVTSTSWDPWRAETNKGTVKSARSGRAIRLDMAPELVGGTGERTLANRLAQDIQQTEVVAQAELDRRIAGEVVLYGVANGNPALHPGVPIDVSGMAESINGQYILTSVIHTFDHHKGYVSEIETKPPQWMQRESYSNTTVGVVTDVTDPEKLGRLRVSLPNFDDIETDWLQVLIPGAGENKGVIALNDLGDNVLLLLNHNDPAQGIILGGLYGTVSPPESGVIDGKIQCYTIKTPGGQVVQLNDDKNSLTVKNAKGTSIRLSPGVVKITNQDGSYLRMTSKKVCLHSKTALDIEAPGQAIVIRGKSIDFESG